MTLDFCKEVQAHTVQRSSFCGADFCPTIAKTLQKLRQLLEGNDSPEPPSCCTTLTPQRMHVQPCMQAPSICCGSMATIIQPCCLARMPCEPQQSKCTEQQVSMLDRAMRHNDLCGRCRHPSMQALPQTHALACAWIKAAATWAARRESNGGRPSRKQRGSPARIYIYIYIFVFCSGGHDHKMSIEDRRPFTRPGRVDFWAPNAGFCIEGAPEPKIRRGPPLKRGNLKIIRGPPLYIYIIIVMGPDYTHAKNLPQEAAGATAHHGRHRCRRIRRRR